MTSDEEKQRFDGSKLLLARRIAGLTQAELSEKVGSSASQLSLVERSLAAPDETLVQALSEVLGFNAEFFYGKSMPFFDTDTVNFRHRARTSETLKSKVAAKASLFSHVATLLDQRLGFPPLDMPTVLASTDQEIEGAARVCRDRWGLGSTAPIGNVVRMAENAGVVVTEFQEADEVDAFSALSESIGVIVLNTARDSTSRARWNIAHELGHLVLHKGITTGDKKTEAQANRFAAALLLPLGQFEAEFRRMARLDWAHLLELKKRWKVSLQAILRRAFDLDLVGAATYRRFFKSLSARGWRSDEPGEPPPETPELMKIAVSALEDQGMSLLDLVQTLAWTPQKMEEITGLSVPQPQPDNVHSLARFKARRKMEAGRKENDPA